MPRSTLALAALAVAAFSRSSAVSAVKLQKHTVYCPFSVKVWVYLKERGEVRQKNLIRKSKQI
jgi:hypothetical protein